MSNGLVNLGFPAGEVVDQFDSDVDFQRYAGYAYYTREYLPKLWGTIGLALDYQESPSNTSIVPATDATDSDFEVFQSWGWSGVRARI